MASQLSSNSGGSSSSGFLAKLKSFVTDPMGIALGAALLLSVVVGYVVVF